MRLVEIFILVEESEVWKRAWVELPDDFPNDLSDLSEEDWDVVTEAATVWASDHGYNFDNWEYE